jgi:hypothetical protein
MRVFNTTFLMLVMAFLGISLSSAIPFIARMMGRSNRGTSTSLAANVSPGKSTATGTHSKSGSRNSYDSKANFAGVGENGLCSLADGIEAQGEALAKGLEAQGEAHGEALAKGIEAQGKAHGEALAKGIEAQGEALAKGIEGGMKYIACSIAFSSVAFSSVAICIAFR